MTLMPPTITLTLTVYSSHNPEVTAAVLQSVLQTALTEKNLGIAPGLTIKPARTRKAKEGQS